jgi:ABC-2 type transport system permease protein
VDSQGLTSALKLPSRLLPLWGVILDDLKQGVRHWALVWWVALSLVLAAVWFIETPTTITKEVIPSPDSAGFRSSSTVTTGSALDDRGEPMNGPLASTLAAKVLRIHLVVWMTLIVVFAGSTMASEADSVASSVLCRGVSRWQYYLGKVIGRVGLTVAAYLGLTVPVFLIALVKCHNDLSFEGTTAALMRSSLLIAGVAALSVAGSSWFRHPLLSVAVAWMVVYGAAIVVSLLRIEPLSPIRFIESVITLPRHPDTALSAARLLTTLGLAALAANIVSFVGFSRRDY